MVDAREVAPDVDLHAIPPPGPGAHEGLVALDRAVGPAARNAGIAVGDEAAPEDRIEHVEERMVHDAVAEGAARISRRFGSFTQKRWNGPHAYVPRINSSRISHSRGSRWYSNSRTSRRSRLP